MIKHRFSDGSPVFVAPLITLDGSVLGLKTKGPAGEAKNDGVPVREQLVLFKNEDGSTQGWIMRIAPTRSYQQQTKGILQNDTFEGNILVYDLADKFVKGFGYQNGHIIRSLAEGNPASARISDVYCRWVAVDWYTIACTPFECTWHYTLSLIHI